MEDQFLYLKWNNHQTTFFHVLSTIRHKNLYTDATLSCESKFFPVHKLVLSSCSDYFSEVFETTSCKSPVVILKGITHQELSSLLDYMYLGEVSVKQADLSNLIEAAKCLKIKGLALADKDPTSRKRSLSADKKSNTYKKKQKTYEASEIVANDNMKAENSFNHSSLVADNMKKDDAEGFSSSNDCNNKIDGESFNDNFNLQIKEKKYDNVAGPSGIKEEDYYSQSDDGSSLYDNDMIHSQADANDDSMEGNNEDRTKVQCPVCQASLRESALYRHLQLHSGEKPYKCIECSFEASRKHCLKRHLLIHSGQKPYECNQCNFQSSRKSSLKRHLLVHSEDKPFLCPICPYKAKQSCHLKSHMGVHNKEQKVKQENEV